MNLSRVWTFIKRWVLPGVWLIIVAFGTYFMFFRREDIDQTWWGLLGYVRIAFVTVSIVLTYAYLLWKQRKA